MPQIEPTSAQLATLKADIVANNTQVFTTFKADPDNQQKAQAVADYYNGVASPDWWVWRTFVAESEIYEDTSADATTWDWTQYIAQSTSEQGAWRQMVSMRGGMKPYLANVRAGIAKIFSGAGAGPTAQRTHLLAIGRRKSSVIEKLLSTGTGSTGSPATMGAEGTIVYNSVQAAFWS